MLLGPDSISVSFLHREAVGRILLQHVKGLNNNEKLLWTLLNLEVFCRGLASSKRDQPKGTAEELVEAFAH